jgi:RNA polymerase sigma factor (sigma-70 family)
MTNLSSDFTSGGPDEAALVLRAIEGDVRAFEVLVGRYQNLACSVAYGACGDLHRSEEIAQEAFISAWRHLDQLKDPAVFRSWLCGIVRNKAADRRRKDLGHDQLYRTAKDGDAGARETDPGPSPAEQAADADEIEMVLRQLRQLPETYREPMILFYRSGESVAGVAQQLDLSEDVVRQRLVRGRAMLAERIEQALGGALRATVPPPGFAAGVVGLLGAGSGAVTAGSGASAKVGAGASSGVWAMASGALLGFWLLYSASKQSALSDKDRRSMERGFWFQVLIFSLFGPGLFYVMIKGGSASHLGAFLLGFGFTAFTQCVIIWSLRCRERSLLAEGVDAASAAKVWRFDYGQKGFWPAIGGYLLILGSGTNYAFTFVAQQLTVSEICVVFATPACLAMVAAGFILAWPRSFQRILMGFLSALSLQYLVFVGVLWSRWRADGTMDQRIVLTSIHSFHAGILLGAVLISYLWWRREGWGHPEASADQQQAG